MQTLFLLFPAAMFRTPQQPVPLLTLISQHLGNTLKHNSIVLACKDVEIWLVKMLLSCYYESNNFQKVKKTPILSPSLLFLNADKVNLISLCNHEQLLDRPHVHNTNDN